jgi:hypothetical protein
MAALTFPATPSIGDVYPADPGTSGVSQYKWDGTKWNAVPSAVSLGTSNQTAFNAYQWPSNDGDSGQRLITDGQGGLSWEAPTSTSFVLVSLLEVFDGVRTSFTMVLPGTSNTYTPDPSGNIVVFLGGVPQTPSAAYTISGYTLMFTEAPEAGTVFYAISSILA